MGRKMGGTGSQSAEIISPWALFSRPSNQEEQNRSLALVPKRRRVGAKNLFTGTSELDSKINFDRLLMRQRLAVFALAALSSFSLVMLIAIAAKMIF